MSQKVENVEPLRLKTKNRLEVCVLTGWPVNGATGIKSPFSDRYYLKDAFTIYQNSFANCPWTGKTL